MGRPRKSPAAQANSKLEFVIQITPRVLDQKQAAAYLCASPYAIEQLGAAEEVKSYLQRASAFATFVNWTSMLIGGIMNRPNG